MTFHALMTHEDDEKNIVRRTCRDFLSCACFDRFLIKGFAKVFTDLGHFV